MVGFHWFNPPHLIPLVEVIRGDRTGDAAMDETYRLATAIGKSPIRVQKDIPGFVGNRLQRALEREFFYLERIGACSGADLEVALKQGLGFRWSVVGPLEHADLAGVDTHSATVSLLFPLLSTDTAPPPLFADARGQGRLGAKTGAGVYEYGPGEVERILARRNAMLIDFIKVLKKHPPLRTWRHMPDKLAASGREAACADVRTLSQPSAPPTSVARAFPSHALTAARRCGKLPLPVRGTRISERSVLPSMPVRFTAEETIRDSQKGATPCQALTMESGFPRRSCARGPNRCFRRWG